MKKILIFTVFLLLLTGCNKSVSQEEYDALVAEFDTLSKNYSELESNHNNRENDYRELSDKYYEASESLAKALLENVNLKLENEDIVIDAWGSSSFGNDTEYSMINEITIQYNVLIGSDTKKELSSFFNSYANNIAMLNMIVTEKNIQYVFIKVVNENCTPVLEIFIDFSESNNIKSDVLINETYDNLISDALNDI